MKFLKLLCLVSLFTLSFYHAQTSNEKIGLLFNLEGPVVIHRQALANIQSIQKNDNPAHKYYDAIVAMGNDRINPTQRIMDFYSDYFKKKNIEYILINEALTEANFPKTDLKEKVFPYDMTVIKKEYQVDKILIVTGRYGLEFENIGFNVIGDKRTNIAFRNYLVNTHDNSILRDFTVQGAQNVKKKNLLTPPDYPNIINSMDRLLNEIIFPKLQRKMQKL